MVDGDGDGLNRRRIDGHLRLGRLRVERRLNVRDVNNLVMVLSDVRDPANRLARELPFAVVEEGAFLCRAVGLDGLLHDLYVSPDLDRSSPHVR